MDEGIISDTGDTVRDCDAGQAATAKEGTLPDAGDAIRDRDARQAGADSEGEIPDAGDAITCLLYTSDAADE